MRNYFLDGTTIVTPTEYTSTFVATGSANQPIFVCYSADAGKSYRRLRRVGSDEKTFQLYAATVASTQVPANARIPTGAAPQNVIQGDVPIASVLTVSAALDAGSALPIIFLVVAVVGIVVVWSLGASVVEMASGQAPWSELGLTDPIALLFHIGMVQGDDHHPGVPEHLSAECRDFLNMCFVIDPKRRATCEQLLAHPFLSTDELAPEGIEEIDSYLRTRESSHMSMMTTLSSQVANVLDDVTEFPNDQRLDGFELHDDAQSPTTFINAATFTETKRPEGGSYSMT